MNYQLQIDGFITPETAAHVRESLAALQSEQANLPTQSSETNETNETPETGEAPAAPAPLNVRINSLGGDFNAALDIRQMLLDYPAPVTAHVFGMTASAATLIATGADRIEISRFALYLIHHAGADVFEDLHVNKEELTQEIEKLQGLRDSLAKIDELMLALYLHHNPEADPAALAAAMEKGDWLTASEALALHLVDDLIEKDESNDLIEKDGKGEKGDLIEKDEKGDLIEKTNNALKAAAARYFAALGFGANKTSQTKETNETPRETELTARAAEFAAREKELTESLKESSERVSELEAQVKALQQMDGATTAATFDATETAAAPLDAYDPSTPAAKIFERFRGVI